MQRQGGTGELASRPLWILTLRRELFTPFPPFILDWAPHSPWEFWLQEVQGLPANGPREEAGPEVGSPPRADTICILSLSFLFLFWMACLAPGSGVLRPEPEGSPRNMPLCRGAAGLHWFAFNCPYFCQQLQCVFGNTKMQSTEMVDRQ